MNKSGKLAVVVIMVIILVMILLYFVGLPLCRQYLANKSCEETYGPGWKAVKAKELPDSYYNVNPNQVSAKNWYCFREEEYDKIMEGKNE